MSLCSYSAVNSKLDYCRSKYHLRNRKGIASRNCFCGRSRGRSVSCWLFLLLLSLVTAPKVFAKVNSTQFPVPLVCKEENYTEHLPQFSSRHQTLHVVVKCYKATKVFDGSNKAMRADTRLSITVVRDEKKIGFYHGLFVCQQQSSTIGLNRKDLKVHKNKA